jgi:hypothetical protein
MRPEFRSTPYQSQRFMLLTQHGKERALAPILLDGLGVRTEVVSGFDTDTLGTFTRDVERAGTQIEAARRKAHIAIERSGGSFGLGSEGSFGPGPFGIGCWNVELLLLADAARGIEVVGMAHGPGLHVHDVAGSEEQLIEIAERAGFPEHGLVVRPDGPDDPRMRKGITTWETLRTAFADARRQSASGQVCIESDLRAYMHPTRMAMIERAGVDLVVRLGTSCPSCGSPGFGVRDTVSGLPCSECGTPTEVPRADIHACVRCGMREERQRPGPTTTDPGHCPYCNP